MCVLTVDCGGSSLHESLFSRVDLTDFRSSSWDHVDTVPVLTLKVEGVGFTG